MRTRAFSLGHRIRFKYVYAREREREIWDIWYYNYSNWLMVVPPHCCCCCWRIVSTLTQTYKFELISDDVWNVKAQQVVQMTHDEIELDTRAWRYCHDNENRIGATGIINWLIDFAPKQVVNHNGDRLIWCIVATDW